ncbi:MAG TPA: hypothetical protein DEQ02_04480 [Ruminococcaceae bacterium]|nr:hypothetical protein [Oscillospiraceae bacterium]
MPNYFSPSDWIAIISILMGSAVSIISATFFSKKARVHDIKKEAIFKSLALIDDFLAELLKYAGEEGVVVSVDRTDKEYTKEARACFNELMLTCNNEALLNAFVKMFFSNLYGNNALQDYEEYRNLCRKELGLKMLKFRGLKEKDFILIGKISPIPEK